MIQLQSRNTYQKIPGLECARNLCRMSHGLTRTLPPSKSLGVLWKSSSSRQPKIFHNDNLKVFLPFSNIVKVNFDSTASAVVDQETGYQNQSIKSVVQSLSIYGAVNGKFICNRGKTGFFNFEHSEAKEDTLKSSIPLNIEDYKVTESKNKHDLRPFRYILCAAYKPSIHSTSRIIRYLDKFGTNAGRDLAKCPYDGDRAFMFFAYNDGRTLLDPGISGENSCIKGIDVSRDYRELDSSPVNDVALYPYMFHDIRKYRRDVKAVTKASVTSSQLRDFLSSKYGDVLQVQGIGENEDGMTFSLLFKDKYSTYRMLYHKTHFGRAVDVIPGTSDEVYLSQSGYHTAMWLQHSLRFFNTADVQDCDVVEYFNSFLSELGCNPGIVSIMRKVNKSVEAYYELYFANEWHTVNVYNRVVLAGKHGAHDLKCSVSRQSNDGKNFYRTMAKFG